jgi:hypothetical protein
MVFIQRVERAPMATSMTENSPKGDNYNLFKHDLKFEDYLDVLDDKDKFLLVKFRNSNHRLPIEVRRWRNFQSLKSMFV